MRALALVSSQCLSLVVLVIAGGCPEPSSEPEAPVLELRASPIKQLELEWLHAAGAEHYQLLESQAPGEPFVRLVDDIVDESISITVPLHLRAEASYLLRACNVVGCTESDPVRVVGSLAEAVGYAKASNTDPQDYFGRSVALSGDGRTLAVGALGEDGGGRGLDGDPRDDSAPHAGAVYVFVRDATGRWSPQAYVKASNADAGDEFGASGLALSDDGDTLVVGAPREDGGGSGLDGDSADDSESEAGAAYVFERDTAGQWSQQAYVKASNPDAEDQFGWSVALSGDGQTLAVGAPGEGSRAAGIGDDRADDSAPQTGAVYVFARARAGQWSQQAYVKASTPDEGDRFGGIVALSRDGDTLAVGAPLEASRALGIDGDEADDSAPEAGAAYVFVRDRRNHWSQQAYVKASNPDARDLFGVVALSGDGNVLAVGAPGEGSRATGLDGNQYDDSLPGAGAVYVFRRDRLGQWSQQAYVKAQNPDADDGFGWSVVLDDDAEVLAIGAPGEAGMAAGIDGDQAYDTASWAGAAHVLVRDARGQWSPRAYVKAPNPDAGDEFGAALALSRDGETLAVGAGLEDGDAVGLGGDQADDSAEDAGAVYLY